MPHQFQYSNANSDTLTISPVGPVMHPATVNTSSHYSLCQIGLAVDFDFCEITLTLVIYDSGSDSAVNALYKFSAYLAGHSAININCPTFEQFTIDTMREIWDLPYSEYPGIPPSAEIDLDTNLGYDNE